MMKLPEVKLGIVAVSRDCFPISLSNERKNNVVSAFGEGIYNCSVVVTRDELGEYR